MNAEATPKQIDISLDRNNPAAVAFLTSNIAKLPNASGSATDSIVFKLKDGKLVGDEIKSGSTVWLDDSRSLVMRGIYKLDDDKLQYCFAQPDADRPGKFEVAKGSKHTLVRLKRFSTGEKPVVDELKAAGVQAQEDEIGWINSLHFSKIPGPIQPLLAKAVSLKKLSSVRIVGKDLTSGDFRQLSRIGTLRQLLVQNKTESVSGFSAFKPAGPLTLLVLTGESIDDQAIEGATVSGLKTLNLRKTSLSTDALADFIDRHPTLTRVDLAGVQVDSKVMIALTKLSHLSTLSVNDKSFGDEEAMFVAQMKSLDGLLVQNSNISDAGLKKLTALNDLTFLRLGSTQVTDDGLRLIGTSFPKLRTLYLWGIGNRFTDDGIRSLVEHPSLNEIHATKPIDDQIVRDTVQNLRTWHRERDDAAEARTKPADH